MFCRKDQGDVACCTQLDKMRPFQGRLAEQDAVVGDDAHRVAVNARKSGDQGDAITRLEFPELAAIHQPGDDLAHIVALSKGPGQNAVEFFGVMQRIFGRSQIGLDTLDCVERRHDIAHLMQSIIVVHSEMIRHAGDAGVNIRPAQFIRRHFLAGSGLHQRRPAQKNRASVLDDDRFIAHRRHIGPTRRARPHHAGDLGDAQGAHLRLIVENAPEVIHIWEDLILHGQISAARIHQVDAGQAVFLGDRLGAQMFLHRHGEISPTLDGGVIGYDHTLPA